MTKRRPPLALRIQSLLILEFLPVYFQGWLFILDGFSWNYLRPHHSGSPLLCDCSSTGGSKSNTWELFSWGCPPLSALTTTMGGDLFSRCNWKHWTQVPLREQVPLTRAQKKLLGVATPSVFVETAQQARVKAVENQPCPVICRGDLSWLGPWLDFPVPLWEIRSAQMQIVFCSSQKARCHKASPQESLVILIFIS